MICDFVWFCIWGSCNNKEIVEGYTGVVPAKSELSHKCLCICQLTLQFTCETYFGKLPLRDMRFKMRKRNPTKAASEIQNSITIESESQEKCCHLLIHKGSLEKNFKKKYKYLHLLYFSLLSSTITGSI